MPENRSLGLYRGLLITAGVIIFLLTVLGGIVRVTQSGGACPDWPTCLGQWSLPQDTGAILNYLHRLMSGLAFIAMLAAAWVARQVVILSARVRTGLAAAIAMMLVQMLLGALVSFQAVNGDQSWISALHLALTLLIQAALLLAIAASYSVSDTDGSLFRELRSPFGRLSVVTLILVFLLLVSGAGVAGLDGDALCRGWPLCNASSLPVDTAGWAHLIHRVLVLASGILMAVVTLRAWKTQRHNTARIVTASAAAVLFFAQALLGSKLSPGAPAYLLGLHQATAAGSLDCPGIVVFCDIDPGFSLRHRADPGYRSR